MDCSLPDSSLSMGLSWQEYWTGLPLSPPGELPIPGIEPVSPALAGGFFTTKLPGKSQHLYPYTIKHPVFLSSGCTTDLSKDLTRRPHTHGSGIHCHGDKALMILHSFLSGPVAQLRLRSKELQCDRLLANSVFFSPLILNVSHRRPPYQIRQQVLPYMIL